MRSPLTEPIIYSPVGRNDDVNDHSGHWTDVSTGSPELAEWRPHSLGSDVEEDAGVGGTGSDSGSGLEKPQHSLRVQLLIYLLYGVAFVVVGFGAYVGVAAIVHQSAYANYSGPADYTYNNNPALGGGYSSDVSATATAPQGAVAQGKMIAALRAAGLGTPQDPIRVSLVGDSMIAKPWSQHQLEQKLLSRLAAVTDASFKFSMDAHYGQTILYTTASLPQYLKDDNSTVVILNHDSDATDTDTASMSHEEYLSFLAQFQDHLSEFAAIAVNGARFVAIAGPNVYGEGPLFKPARFTSDKAKVLEDVRQISMTVAKKYQIPYIDMKSAVASVKPSWYLPYRYWCTQDGEHFNELGSSIEADNFVYFLSL